MVCNAAPAQHHVGRDETQTIARAILKDTGARTLRWGPPHGAWTIDCRSERANVRHDEQMTIIGITCG
jgi:phage-related protein